MFLPSQSWDMLCPWANNKCVGVPHGPESLMSSTCITSTTIDGAGQHSFNTCLRCTWYIGCRPTHPIPAQCCGQHCSPLLVQCRSIVYDADPALIYISPGMLYILRVQARVNQYCFNVDPQSSTLARHLNSLGRLYRLFWLLHYAGDFEIPEPETPDNTIH